MPPCQLLLCRRIGLDLAEQLLHVGGAQTHRTLSVEHVGLSSLDATRVVLDARDDLVDQLLRELGLEQRLDDVFVVLLDLGFEQTTRLVRGLLGLVGELFAHLGVGALGLFHLLEEARDATNHFLFVDLGALFRGLDVANYVLRTHLPLAQVLTDIEDLGDADARVDDDLEDCAFAVFDALRDLDFTFAGEQ
jgi:hypothetical protein